MDSKLVVEQMSGSWKIKHPDMQPLALQAQPARAGRARRTPGSRASRTSTPTGWLNEALDGLRRRGLDGSTPGDARSSTEPPGEASAEAPTRLVRPRHRAPPRSCWCATASPTTPSSKRFSGGLAAATPGSTDEGRAQVRATADWLAPLAERIDAVVTSPVRRTRESRRDPRRGLGPRGGRRATGSPRWSSAPGTASTFAEVAERYPDELDAWLGSLDARARRRRVVPGGARSACSASLRRLLEEHAGETVLVVSHVTPIKMLVAHAARRAAGVGVPDGAGARLGHGAVVLRTTTGPRCGCSTPVPPTRR